jgi:hypothetical protein
VIGRAQAAQSQLPRSNVPCTMNDRGVGLAASSLFIGDEIAESDPQLLCEEGQGLQRRRNFPKLHRTHMGPREVWRPKLRLGQTALIAQRAHQRADFQV